MRFSSLLLLLLAGLGLKRSHNSGGVSAQVTSYDVRVDLRPCFLTQVEIAPDTDDVTEAYVLYQLFQGMWASSITVKLVTTDVDDLSLAEGDYDTTAGEYTTSHGLCSVVFVAIVPSTLQFTILTAYSQRFQVRIVYFNEALTADNTDFTTKLGVGNYDAGNLQNIETIMLTDAAEPRVINSNLKTFPKPNDIYARPVRKTGDGVGGTATVVAEYGDAAGESITVTEAWKTANASGSNEYQSAAAVTYVGENGEEEMHVFFAMGWFDVGSWAWAHYIAEWATKGIFAGERRFWLGAVVDDLYLGTSVFDTTATNNEGEEVRMSASDLRVLLAATTDLNSKYHSEIVTEFALNGLGILEQVDSAKRLDFEDADGALLPKGDAPQDNGDGTIGMDDIHPRSWLSQGTIDAMAEEFSSSDSNVNWKANDLLLAESITLQEDFFWQSHTLSHLARDNLGLSDCYTEDTGNTEIAVLTGLYDATTYNWRSMTTPGITGLFNANCLQSAKANLITCAPGDNTYNTNLTPVKLVDTENQFHALETTVEINGFAGSLIVPRFATFVYYNCATPECLILENLSIRRDVCECNTTDPGTIGALQTDIMNCTEIKDGGLCENGLEAFGTSDALFLTEAETTARWIMTGRRDKYMFHQANVIPTSINATVNGTKTTVTRSLLHHWYEVVMEYMADYLNLEGTDPFVLTSKKFDDLCTNFIQHAELDDSASLITVTKTPEDKITWMELNNAGSVGVIPVTIPTTMINDVLFDGLPTGQPYDSVTYGSDTTYYVASSQADEPVVATKPTNRETAFLPTEPTSSPTSSPTPAPVPDGSDGAKSGSAYPCPDGQHHPPPVHDGAVDGCEPICPPGKHPPIPDDGVTSCVDDP